MAKITIEKDGEVKVIETDCFAVVADEGTTHDDKGIATNVNIVVNVNGTGAQKYGLYKAIKNAAFEMAKKDPMLLLLDVVMKEKEIEI